MVRLLHDGRASARSTVPVVPLGDNQLSYQARNLMSIVSLVERRARWTSATLLDIDGRWSSRAPLHEATRGGSGTPPEAAVFGMIRPLNRPQEEGAMCPAVELARSRRPPKCFRCTSSSGHIAGSPPSLGPRPSSTRGCARLSRVRLLDEDEIFLIS